MTKRKSRSTNKNSNAASSVVEIPRELVAAIKRSWPRDVVEEFDTDESYFHEIRHQIERDLRRISGVSLVWQTEDVDRGACDDEDEALPSYSEWQSYHVFFVSPEGDEFRFEDETIGEDPGDGTETAFSGEGRFGISLTISLAAPVAAIGVSSYSHYEDGGYTIPDPMSSLHMNEETGIVISANEYFRDCLGQEMFQKLEILREQITSIVALRHISVLESVLDLPVQSLKADQEVFVGKPVCVRDAFFSAECDRHFSDSCGKHHRTPARQSDHFRCGTTGWRS